MQRETTERILQGIENNEFQMHLQFVVDNKTKKIVSAEALPSIGEMARDAA